MRLSALSILSVLVVTITACSGADAVDEDDTSTESELRALDATEVVGDITYGTSAMDVQHPGETNGRRVYRAVRFQGTAGDEIDADAIGANAADPVLYLLGQQFQTLKSNDDRAPGDKQPALKVKLSRTGTYYLAFRTKEGWRTKFYVSLRKTKATVTPPPPPAEIWKSAFAGADLWGTRFVGIVPAPGSSGGRKDVYCNIVPSRATISCGLNPESTHVSAAIAADGSFAATIGTPAGTGGELGGSVAVDGSVTLTQYRRTECFQTSWRWCERTGTDGQNIPARATPYELCRTPDQTFGQGGWASGYYLACSQCQGRCIGGR